MLDSEALETLWQRHPRPWCEHRSFTITEKGVALGADTLIVPIVKDAYGRTTLALDGHEDRILALLSVAHDKPVSPVVLENFRAASRALAKGDESLALICLAQSGLFALHGWNYERNADGAAKALFMADQVLQDGMDTGALLKGLGLLPEGLSPAEWHTLAKYNENHVPAGCPEGGQFCSAEEAGGSGTGSPNSETTGIEDTERSYQVAANDTGTMTDAGGDDRQAENDRRFPYDQLYLADGSPVYSPFKVEKTPIEIPKDVSLSANAQIGEQLRDLSPEVRMYRLYQMFCRGGTMDYQSRYSIDDKYNARFISIGNFNYGAVMAAAGYSLDEAKDYAAFINSFGGGEKRYYLFGGNPKNELMIESGYNAYKNHNLPKR